MIFSFKKKEKSTYKLIREEKNQFQGFLNQNYTEMDITIELLDEDLQKFRIKIENYKQSNDKGLFKWVGDLHFIRNNIECTIAGGQLNEVYNLDKLKSLWQSERLSVISKHANEKYADIIINGIDEIMQEPKHFADTLKYASPYINIFPGIHGKDFKQGEKVEGYRELPNFLVTKTLPIITEEELFEAEDNTYEIRVTGKVDEKKYDLNQASSMVKILKNRPRVPSEVDLKYMERHLLNEKHWPEQSLIMSVAHIPGTLYREEKTMLKAI